MPAPRTTRTTTAPDSTVPEAAGSVLAADDPGTQDGATDPTTTPTAAGPDSPAPRASTRHRRGTRSPNATTATPDDPAPEPGTDSAPPDTAAPDPAAAEATTDDVAPASDTDTDTDTDTGDGGDKSPVADDVWAELRKQPGCTATELARSVPASRSVVLKLLNRWCAEGSVDTTPGATTRAATRYFALPSTLPPADTTTTGEPTSSAPSEPTPPGQTSIPGETTKPPMTTVPPQGETAHTGTADTHDTGTPGPARTNSSGSVRLGSGALHGMVEDFLREHPDGEHGPVAVAKAVGRSSGAVANALERMVSSGWAVRTSDKPKRYRIADTSDDVPTRTPAPAPDSGAPTAAGDTRGAAPVGPVVGVADGGPGDDRDDGTDNAAGGATARAGRGGRVSNGSARSGRKERATTVPG